MIFPKEQANAVARGAVTQTRRLVMGRCQLRVGRDYAVQPGAGRPSVCRIKVNEITHAQAGEITYREAKVCGYKTTDDFKVSWTRAHDRQWVERERVDLVAVYDDNVSIVKWILLKRFEQHHARTPVWVIRFEVQPDVPRFMAHATRTNGDYVHHPARAIDREECIDEQTNNTYAKASHAEGERMRASFRADLEDERARRRRLRVEMLRGV